MSVVVHTAMVEDARHHAKREHRAESSNAFYRTCTPGSVRGGSPQPFTGACYAFRMYRNAGHACFADSQPSSQAAAAQDLWPRSVLRTLPHCIPPEHGRQETQAACCGGPGSWPRVLTREPLPWRKYPRPQPPQRWSSHGPAPYYRRHARR
jgi:hypothetical protein